MGKKRGSVEPVEEMQKEIMQFVINYCEINKSGYPMRVPGRDAYAAIQVFTNNKSDLCHILNLFNLDINVG